MEQGVKMAAVALSLGLLAAAPAVAGVSDDAACAAVQETVRTQVLAASTRPLGKRGYPVLPPADLGGECRDAVKAVSSGFTQAMAALNVFVTWQTPDRQRGDLCLGHYLSQCYPERDGAVPYGPADAAFVRDAWFAVRRAVDRAASQSCGGIVRGVSASRLEGLMVEELRGGERVVMQQGYYVR